MAGNVGDWTIEAYETYSRIDRGGLYSDSSNFYPAYIRHDSLSIVALDNLGFRVALYM